MDFDFAAIPILFLFVIIGGPNALLKMIGLMSGERAAIFAIIGVAILALSQSTGHDKLLRRQWKSRDLLFALGSYALFQALMAATSEPCDRGPSESCGGSVLSLIVLTPVLIVFLAVIHAAFWRKRS